MIEFLSNPAVITLIITLSSVLATYLVKNFKDKNQTTRFVSSLLDLNGDGEVTNQEIRSTATGFGLIKNNV